MIVTHFIESFALVYHKRHRNILLLNRSFRKNGRTGERKKKNRFPEMCSFRENGFSCRDKYVLMEHVPSESSAFFLSYQEKDCQTGSTQQEQPDRQIL